MKPRRTFLQNAAVVMGGLSLRNRVPALAALGPKGMHDELAKKARAVKKRAQALTVLYPKGCLGNLEPIKQRFSQATGVDVRLVEASLDEISSEMILSHKLGKTLTSFDVAIPPTFAIPDLVSSGTIADLTDFARKHEPMDFRKSYLYSTGDHFGGSLYGYQTDGDVYLLFVRKSWLEDTDMKRAYKARYGEELKAPATWEELDRQIAFFNQPERERFGGTLFRNRNYMLWEYWVRLHAKGVTPFDESMKPQIATAKGIEALADMMAVTPHLDPRGLDDGLFENFQRFGAGHSYCTFGWGGTEKYLHGPKSSVRDDLIFLPMPGSKEGTGGTPVSYFNWGWNYVVSAQSSQQELAYLFSAYATSPMISTLAVREASGYFDPYREEHYMDRDIQKTYGTPFLEAHRAAMRRSIPDLYIARQGLYLDALKQAIYLATRGQVPAEAALQSAAKRWDEITKAAGLEKQRAQWLELRKQYPTELLSRL